MKTKPGPGGIAPSTLIQICRDHKWMMVSASDLQANDFVSSGFGGVGWRVEAVEIIRSSIRGWKLVLRDGIELVCADGTVLAGFAGPVLPSDPGAIPALAFIRHPVNTREARRRFSVRLIDGEKHGSPAIRRLFGTRLRYGSREQRREKVFYFYQQAASFLATCKNAEPAMRIFSAVDVTLWCHRPG